MSKEASGGYSQTSTLLIAVIIAIAFGYLGYWYGSVNPGGFSTMSVQEMNIGELLNTAPRDHPGTVTADKETNEQIYDNPRIGLTFHAPAGYQVKDFWPGDATDLMITASSFEYLSVINTKNEFPMFDQMQISYFESLQQLNSTPLADVNNLDEYITKYSTESLDTNGTMQKPYFTNPEKVQVGNLEGYKATLSKEYADGNESGTIYVVDNNSHYYSIIFRDSKGANELRDKVLSTISFN